MYGQVAGFTDSNLLSVHSVNSDPEEDCSAITVLTEMRIIGNWEEEGWEWEWVAGD